MRLHKMRLFLHPSNGPADWPPFTARKRRRRMNVCVRNYSSLLSGLANGGCRVGCANLTWGGYSSM